MNAYPETKPPAEWQFDNELVVSLLAKMGYGNGSPTRSLTKLSLEQLRAQLDGPEMGVIQQVLDLQPRPLGFLGPFVSLEGPPANLVSMGEQSFNRTDKEVTIVDQYLPQPVKQAFLGLQSAIKQDLGSHLMVESGYRSPAHQALVFLTFLHKSHYDVKYVASGVALPGYSQHGDPVNTAIDVINQAGIPTDEEPQLFADTAEYRWLLKNASQFDFHLSYPQGNPDGIKFEPWHWQYKPGKGL